jgi:hypothetical protein
VTFVAAIITGLFPIAPLAGQAKDADAKPRGGPFPQQLTVYDPRGQVVRTLGEPANYGQMTFSPDGTRIAVAKRRPVVIRPGVWAFDPSAGAIRPDDNVREFDIWTFHISTGAATQITSEPGVKWMSVWSPDGSRIAYVARRNGYDGLYQKASNGTGREELLHRHTLGASIWNLTDWSPDGRFVCFASGGVLLVLPFDGDRTAVELVREEYSVGWCGFSPDGRFLAYDSDESGRDEIYVRPFEAPSRSLSTTGRKWQVSTKGGTGLFWARTGELYYLAADGAFMAVEVTTTPTLQVGTSKVLFRWSGTTFSEISRDGERALARYRVFSVRTPPPERNVVTVPLEVLARYVGTYALSPFEWDYLVTLEDGRLMLQVGTANGKSPLFPESDTYFFRRTPEGDTDFEFVEGVAGKVTHLIQHGGGHAGGVKWTLK